jgi:glycosyltransferase involved in cell wall biosynthesis
LSGKPTIKMCKVELRGSMKIGFDVSQTGRHKAGCGYFADNLIEHLGSQPEGSFVLYPTFGNTYWDDHWQTDIRHLQNPRFKTGLSHASYEALKGFWRNPPPHLDQQMNSPDIVHANNFFCPVGLETARLVYTLHDLAFLEYPEWSTPENWNACFEGVFNASLYADAIIAVSQYSRQHFLQLFPHYPENCVQVVYEASRFVKTTFFASPNVDVGLDVDRFWLHVGTIEPRKNHERLLAAYARYVSQVQDPFSLVLVGARGWLMEHFEAQIEALDLESRVIRLGYVDDATLRWLYESCFAFIYPSLFEGFGLPVVEAMSLGAAVIASNVTSLPEVVGDAGLLIDPLSVEAISNALIRLATGHYHRAELKQKALKQAENFSWEQTAERVMQIYKQVLAQPAS